MPALAIQALKYALGIAIRVLAAKEVRDVVVGHLQQAISALGDPRMGRQMRLPNRDYLIAWMLEELEELQEAETGIARADAWADALGIAALGLSQFREDEIDKAASALRSKLCSEMDATQVSMLLNTVRHVQSVGQIETAEARSKAVSATIQQRRRNKRRTY